MYKASRWAEVFSLLNHHVSLLIFYFSGSTEDRYDTILERMGSTRNALRLFGMVNAALYRFHPILGLAHWRCQ
jgi:hypothetical protein